MEGSNHRNAVFFSPVDSGFGNKEGRVNVNDIRVKRREYFFGFGGKVVRDEVVVVRG